MQALPEVSGALMASSPITISATFVPIPVTPVTYSGTATFKFPRQRPRKTHLKIKTSEVAGIPIMWAACNIRSRPEWFQKNYPLMSNDPKDVTCKNCLRRM